MKQNKFIKNIFLLASGTLIAQLISLLISPILTRLYSPAAFGEFGVYSSLLAVFSVMICFRYELAIMLPKEKRQVAAIYKLANCICTCNVVLISLGFIFLRDNLPSFFFFGKTGGLVAVAFLVQLFFTGVYSINNYWYTREGSFKQLSTRQIIYACLVAVVEILLSFVFPTTSGVGLILGVSVATALTSIILSYQIIIQNQNLLRCITFKDMKMVAWKFKDFPLFSSWTSVVNTLSSSLPSLMFSFFYEAETVGCYNLCYKILDMPIGLIGGSVAQAFYPKLNESTEIEQKKKITLSIFDKLFEIAFVPFVLMSIAAPWIYVIIFGEEWLMSGYFTRLLVPWLLLVFVSSPISNLYVVLNKQKEGLVVNCIMLISRFCALLIGGKFQNSMIAVGLFSGVGAAMWIFNTIYIMSFVNISLKEIIAPVKNTIRSSIKYLVIPVTSLLINNNWTFIISFMFGLLFLGDLIKKYKRGDYDI